MHSIRLANIEDIPEIVRLNIDEYSKDKKEWEILSIEKKYEIAMWWGEKSLLEWHFSILDSCDGGILVAVHDNKIIAELDYVYSEDYEGNIQFTRLHIIWLLVSETFRSRGIATDLIQHLKNSCNHEIWVEAEDERSNNLYNRLGRKRKVLMNLSIHESIHCAENIKSTQIHEFSSLQYKSITNNLKMLIIEGKVRVLMGRYFSPSYDFMQLTSPDPINVIWGNMDPADIIIYSYENSTYFAFITQYPRLYIKGIGNGSELQFVLLDLISRVLDNGFASVEFQYYQDDIPRSIIEKIGVPKEDIVYSIN